jgi:hypothetical protein
MLSEPIVKFERVNLPDFSTRGGLYLLRIARFSDSQLIPSDRELGSSFPVGGEYCCSVCDLTEFRCVCIGVREAYCISLKIIVV